MNRNFTNNTSISIVAPVYNEEAVIGQFISRISSVMAELTNYDFELILIDDGSTDHSLEIMKDIAISNGRIQVIELMRNFGQTPALCAGIDEAKGEIIITLDSDLQHFPEEIPLFIKKIEEGYDLVCGWRKDRQEGVSRKWPSRAANYLIHKISKIDIHDFGTTFRAYRRGILKNIDLFGEMHRFIPALASRSGCRIAEIPIKNVPRVSGKSNYGISRTYGVGLDLIFLIFYLHYLSKPLRIFGILAALLFSPGFFIAAMLTIFSYLGFIQSVKDHIALLLFSILLIVLGVNFLCYGLIAEVQNRIYYTVKKEKIYNIRRVWSSDSLRQQ